MNLNKLWDKNKVAVNAIVLASFISLILSIGVKWILTFILIPIMFFLVFLGVNIEIKPDILSSRLSIVSFVLAFAYIIFGDRLIRKTKKK